MKRILDMLTRHRTLIALAFFHHNAVHIPGGWVLARCNYAYTLTSPDGILYPVSCDMGRFETGWL